MIIDPTLVMGGCAAGLAGFVGYKAFLDKPKNERDWMTLKDAKAYGLIGNERTGVILGDLNGVTLSDRSSNHFGYNGTTGVGKSATIVKLLLMNTRYGFIVSDPSGDLWRLTSGIRSRYGPVYRLDPSEPNTSLYNPLDDVMYSENMYADLANVFRSLMVTQAKTQAKADPHWTDKPVELAPVYAMQLLLGDDPTRKNMAYMLSFIRSGRDALVEMFQHPNHPKCREVAASLLRELSTGGSAYLGSLISSMVNPLSIWDDVNLARMTSGSSFRIDEVATSKDGPVTIYMTAPAKDLKRLTPFYRLVRDMTKIHLLYRKQITLRGERKIWSVMSIIDETQDEAPEELDKTLAICRKYGLRYGLGWQSLDAAESMYGKHFFGLMRSNITFRPTTGDDVVKRLSAMSGFYEKKKYHETEDRKGGLVWRKSSRRVEEEWKPRLEPWDFERWSAFGTSMFTHTGKPALLRMTDPEVDPRYMRYILPEYELPEPRRLVSPWDRSVPTVDTLPSDDVDEEPFRDEHSIGDEDEDVAIV